jgi:hypothetical protein
MQTLCMTTHNYACHWRLLQRPKLFAVNGLGDLIGMPEIRCMDA